MSATEISKIETSTVSVTKKVYWEVPIPNFSRDFFTEYETGKTINSDTFLISTGNKTSTKWNLSLYPNGDREESKSSVGLYLCCENVKKTAFDFTAKFKFGVKKDNGEDCFISAAEIVRSKEDLKVGYGQPKFLSHEKLFDEENCYVVGGKLVIFVELTVETESAKPPLKVALSSSPFADFKKMFDNDALSDFELKTSDGKVLKTHRFALAARSPVFYAMLTTDLEETKQGFASVPDFDSKIMTEVLRFIYCNEVEELEEIAPELIFAAEKYQLEELKDICLKEIVSSVQLGNAVKFLKIAYRVSDAEDLFEKCLDLIVNNYPEVSQEHIWKDLPNELMSHEEVVVNAEEVVPEPGVNADDVVNAEDVVDVVNAEDVVADPVVVVSRSLPTRENMEAYLRDYFSTSEQLPQDPTVTVKDGSFYYICPLCKPANYRKSAKPRKGTTLRGTINIRVRGQTFSMFGINNHFRKTHKIV